MFRGPLRNNHAGENNEGPPDDPVSDKANMPAECG